MTIITDRTSRLTKSAESTIGNYSFFRGDDDGPFEVYPVAQGLDLVQVFEHVNFFDHLRGNIVEGTGDVPLAIYGDEQFITQRTYTGRPLRGRCSICLKAEITFRVTQGDLSVFAVAQGDVRVLVIGNVGFQTCGAVANVGVGDRVEAPVSWALWTFVCLRSEVLMILALYPRPRPD